MRVVVIGAGIAGLGAATYIARRGHQVQVLEAGARIGGRARVFERGGDRCDVGTQYYHTSYTRALDLIREVGLGQERRKISGAMRFFDPRARGGTFLLDHRLPYFRSTGLRGNLHVARFAASQLLRHRIRTYELEDRPELDETLASDVVKDPDVWNVLVRMLLMGGALTEPEPTRVSMFTLIQLMRAILLADYFSFAGGVSALHERLAARLEVRCEAPVKRLVTSGSRSEGVLLESDEMVPADHVVVATTAAEAAALLPGEWEIEREFLKGVTMPPALIASFFLDRPLQQGVYAYFFPSGSTVGFCTDAQQKNPEMAPSGHAILQAWICYPHSADWIARNDQDVIDVCRRQIEEYLPGFSSWIEEAIVTHYRFGVPWHPVGHRGRALRFLASADKRPGISFCGDYISGGGMECALWSAERAAARVG